MSGEPVSERFVHEVTFAASDAAIVLAIVPFVAASRAAGEPMIAAVGAEELGLVRSALGDIGGLDLIDPRSPLSALDETRGRVLDHLAAGAARVRVTHVVPLDADATAFEERCRCEAVVNLFLADLPVQGRCIYNTSSWASAQLAQVGQIHPFSASEESASEPNTSYVPPSHFLSHRLENFADPFAGQTPTITVVDPTPAVARAMVRPILAGDDIDPEPAADLLVALSEIVTNAIVHGRAPVTVRAWRSPGSLVVAVSDRGTGPADPLAGYTRPGPERRTGGLGLWLARRLTSLVDWRDERGYTVQLRTRTRRAATSGSGSGSGS